MVFDRLDRSAVYDRLGERFARGFEYLRRTRLDEVPPGNYPIVGRDVFAMVQQVTTRPVAESRWEAHRRYADIQYIVRGSERMGVRDIGSLSIAEAYDADRDVLFLEGASGPFVEVHAGQFCIFFPHDAHMPCLQIEASQIVLKAVIKVALD